MSQSHTPGEWKVVQRKSGGWHVYATFERGEAGPDGWLTIANVPNPKEYMDSARATMTGEEQSEANARLISASPEMLMLCRMVAPELARLARVPPNLGEINWPMLSKLCDEAIAKATGVI